MPIERKLRVISFAAVHKSIDVESTIPGTMNSALDTEHEFTNITHILPPILFESSLEVELYAPTDDTGKILYWRRGINVNPDKPTENPFRMLKKEASYGFLGIASITSSATSDKNPFIGWAYPEDIQIPAMYAFCDKVWPGHSLHPRQLDETNPPTTRERDTYKDTVASAHDTPITQGGLVIDRYGLVTPVCTLLPREADGEAHIGVFESSPGYVVFRKEPGIVLLDVMAQLQAEDTARVLAAEKRVLLRRTRR